MGEEECGVFEAVSGSPFLPSKQGLLLGLLHPGRFLRMPLWPWEAATASALWSRKTYCLVNYGHFLSTYCAQVIPFYHPNGDMF